MRRFAALANPRSTLREAGTDRAAEDEDSPVNHARTRRTSAGDTLMVLGTCLAIVAVVTLGIQGFYWFRWGEWPNLVIGDVWMVSDLRSFPVDSETARQFIDQVLDIPLSEGLFALAGVAVCLGGAIFVRRGSR